jgi:hypothetical protein
MKENGPDQFNVPPRVEDDLHQRLTPMKSYRHFGASLPLALVAILVVATVAFGATVVRPLVVGPNPSATPVADVGDDNPDESPSASVSVEPSAEPSSDQTEDPTAKPTPTRTTPTSGSMSLTAKLSGFKVVLTWSAYDGTDFAYYKVVRSPDNKLSWPLGENDKLAAAVSNRDQLTITDAPPTGATVSYEVFAVKSTDDGFAVLDMTNVATIAVPKPTPKPTAKPTPNCSMRLTASVKSGHVHLAWTKYVCSGFQYYVVVRGGSNKVDVPLPHVDSEAQVEIDSVGQLSWNDYNVQPGHTYYYRVMAWNSESNCEGGTVLAKTNLVHVTIPVPATPTEPPAPTDPPASDAPAA